MKFQVVLLLVLLTPPSTGTGSTAASGTFESDTDGTYQSDTGGTSFPLLSRKWAKSGVFVIYLKKS